MRSSARKINRVDLVHRAWRMLEGFLTAHPDDPAADQAAFSAANALLELKEYGAAAEACDRYARRYPKSELLDSYWYVIGYGRFATGKHRAAMEMCRKVAEHTRIDPRTGEPAESENKWRAIYILGQVYDSLGQPAEAIRQYRLVEDRFADARQSIAALLRKNITLPETTAVRPGEPVELELGFRNLAACDVKVYRIDLIKFGLLRARPGRGRDVNLAGIHPSHETTVKLGDGQDYRDRKRKLSLPLAKEGAYLVVCRGEDRYATGLVLVTPLVLEVTENLEAGQVLRHGQGRGHRARPERRARQGDRQPEQRFRLRRNRPPRRVRGRADPGRGHGPGPGRPRTLCLLPQPAGRAGAGPRRASLPRRPSRAA